MTKCIVLGETHREEKEEKYIEFCKVFIIDEDNECIVDSFPSTPPNNWKNIELIKRSTTFDFMFAYDDNRSGGCLYIGHWNNGKVKS